MQAKYMANLSELEQGNSLTMAPQVRYDAFRTVKPRSKEFGA